VGKLVERREGVEKKQEDLLQNNILGGAGNWPTRSADTDRFSAKIEKRKKEERAAKRKVQHRRRRITGREHGGSGT